MYLYLLACLSVVSAFPVETFSNSTGVKCGYKGTTSVDFPTGRWTLGTSTVYVKNSYGNDNCDGDIYCIRMKKDPKVGYSRLTMEFDWIDVKSLTYKIGGYGSDLSQSVSVYMSTDGGESWTSIGSGSPGDTPGDTPGGPFSVTYSNLGVKGPLRFEWRCNSSSSVNIDSITYDSNCDISSCLGGLRGKEFRNCLHIECYMNRTRTLGYWGIGIKTDSLDTITGPVEGYSGNARMHIYSYIWNNNTGPNKDTLVCLYSGFRSKWSYGNVQLPNIFVDFMNLEHIVPQAAFRYPHNSTPSEPMRSDMHHMAPTHITANGGRYRFDYGVLNGTEPIDWYYNGTYTTSIPEDPTNYSKCFNNSQAMLGMWEPRMGTKGIVARALMYMYTMYIEQLEDYAKLQNPHSSPDIFPGSGKITDFITLENLCSWDLMEPATTVDIERDEAIASSAHQRNHNPYVKHAGTLVLIDGVPKTLCEVAFGYE
jgi:endonuclease I